MIGPGDRVLIGISGGKDSLALSLALVERKKWVPVDYELFAVQVEWREYPFAEEEKSAVDAFFRGLEIPFRRIQASIDPGSFGRRFSCYTCSRNRKRLLFEEARRVGARRIALGHHLDDIAQTTLMNLFFRGEFSTMMPVQQFFGGKISIIRPLCEVREAEVARVAARIRLPTVPHRCPNAQRNHRAMMKDILRQVSRVERHAVTNLYSAAWRVNAAYLPTVPRNGAEDRSAGTGARGRGGSG